MSLDAKSEVSRKEFVRFATLICAILVLVVVSSVLIAWYARSAMNSIADLHVEGNTPKSELFDEYLERDLTSYFCSTTNDCRVQYEFLRKGATQNGVSYPKYYLWVKCLKNGKLTSQGAVRVAAINQNYFEVTHFISANEVLESPDEVGNIFPAALVETIQKKSRL